MFNFQEIDKKNTKKVLELVQNRWGSDFIVSKGKKHFISDLDGFIVLENEEIKGLITYSIEGTECEIVSLDSFKENLGIGEELIKLVETEAGKAGCKRIWLITTNDNTRALRFYQKRGFVIENIHLNAIKESRKIKPQIPERGFGGIPILHEIELGKEL